MTLHLAATNDDPKLVAVLYGPVVLAGDMGTEGMSSHMPFSKDQLDYRKVPVPDDIVTTLNVGSKKLNDWLIPVTGKPLTFTTVGVSSKTISLVPFYRIDKQRYVIYWDMK